MKFLKGALVIVIGGIVLNPLFSQTELVKVNFGGTESDWVSWGSGYYGSVDLGGGMAISSSSGLGGGENGCTTGIYTDAVRTSYIFINTGDNSEHAYTISGLDNSKQYSLEFFSSRIETGSDRKTYFRVGADEVSVDADGNTNETIWLQNLSPSNGQITYYMRKASTATYGYVNALIIYEVEQAANTAPNADAGADIAVSLPTNTATLDGSGSSDPEGDALTYAWTQAEGPNTATISSAVAMNPGISNLVAGTYVFELTVNDGSLSSTTDQVSVVVSAAPNSAPNADAGDDIAVTLPTNSATLNGSGSSDPEGDAITYAWTQAEGPNTATISSAVAMNPGISNLVAGTYVFELTVNDGSLSSTTDQVSVVVSAAPNSAPNANAGADISVTLPTNTATLDGSGSSDPEGDAITYAWTQANGPNTATISSITAMNPGISNLVAGTYVFELTVNDGSLNSTTDQVSVVVSEAPNSAPNADAGADISVTLPTNTVTLNGSGSSDPEGDAITYAWAQADGPNTATISSTTAMNPSISNLVAGTYVFELTVNDGSLSSTSDQVSVVVSAAPNSAPAAKAGPDIAVTLPTNIATLDGSLSSDPDGDAINYSWTQTGGPSTATISDATLVNPVVSNLLEGSYTFALTVDDGVLSSTTDEVNVVVSSVPNTAPIANAGADITIILPTNVATLNGALSSDPEDDALNYSWQYISGPGGYTIVSPGTMLTEVNGLVAGEYVFELTVNDGALSSTDQVLIMVIEAVGGIWTETTGGITYENKVGIGTTDLDAELNVKGRIKAEWIDVIDNVPTADYVFEADYKLRKLEEVEHFIKQNKHLPEVPSAKEFQETGYAIHQMDNLLLQKVEELTLYIIEQDKRINQQQELIEQLLEVVDSQPSVSE